MMLKQDQSVLRGRYTLVAPIDVKGEPHVWSARDVYGGPTIIKAWAYSGTKPNDVFRASWDVELRHLFRLASLPGAEEHLVVLRDAGVDKENGHFVMALSAPGLMPLAIPLKERARCDWLRDHKNPSTRRELWSGLRRLANGLVQLHEQQMIHRAISADTVLVDNKAGPSSMRLGGFEWTVRIGSAPSTAGAGGYSFELDWFMFGALAARVIANVNAPTDDGSSDEITKVVQQIHERDMLIGAERELLDRLLTHDPETRLAHGYQVIERLNDIITHMDQPSGHAEGAYLALLALLGPQRPLTLAILEQKEDIKAIDIESQRAFLEEDVKHPKLIRQPSGGRDGYIVVGNRLSYYITEHTPDGATGTGAWELAYCGDQAQVRYSSGPDEQVPLDKYPIKVFTLQAFFKNADFVRRSAVSWRSYLPRADDAAATHDKLDRFYDFFRVTSQIELLMHDAEIFEYEIMSKKDVEGAVEITVKETERRRQSLSFVKAAEGLADYLRVQAEEKQNETRVYLGLEDALDPGRQVTPAEAWTFEREGQNKSVLLRRAKAPSLEAPPPRGFLRSFGLFGQMSLVRRRRRAIEKLKGHAYLLQALQRPGFVQLDSGEVELPVPPEQSQIDEAKHSAMRSIWRTRPIFALQGPPGTGKTTLVANLLGQIFEDDPVAQVLVTAQAHTAVDVLLEKVSKEFSQRGEGRERPLSVRLPRSKDDQKRDPEYVEQVTARVLEGSVRDLRSKSLMSIQERWISAAEEASSALKRGDTEGLARDMCELVKRSAGITYSTTTAGNLAELADTTQTFDWSIIEEAGKAHGFDLVLPLQTGHRWLLIGDQDQLHPYRFANFGDALSRLDEVFEALRDLPDRAGGQLDMDLLLRWQRYTPQEKDDRKKLWQSWLAFFRQLYQACLQANEVNEEPGAPVLARMLSQQHRMHPVIAELVSKAYYRGGIKSATIVEGELLDRVVHPFVSPSPIEGRAIVWIDVPWVKHGGKGERTDGRYTAPEEVNAIKRFLSALETKPDASKMALAVLSPYRLQVIELSKALRGVIPLKWQWPPSEGEQKRRRSIAATVDSFQGDQADVVIVSLVRNNMRDPGHGFGFLQEPERMNVLFSRAERLLVLVGSWEFFQHQLRDVPTDPVQPLGKWRIALDHIEACLRSGSAVKITTSALPEAS